LSASQKERVDKAIQEIFKHYKTFEEFEKEMIDKSEQRKTPNGSNEVIASFLYRIHVELSTRKAGIPINEDNDVIEEIYDSWYKLFCNLRDEMKSLPVTNLKEHNVNSAVINLVKGLLNDALRPHLTEHQAKFRKWMQEAKRESRYKKMTPQELQKKYPDYDALIVSLRQVNKRLIEYSDELHTM
jgi:hypothetical protein